MTVICAITCCVIKGLYCVFFIDRRSLQEAERITHDVSR